MRVISVPIIYVVSVAIKILYISKLSFLKLTEFKGFVSFDLYEMIYGTDQRRN